MGIPKNRYHRLLCEGLHFSGEDKQPKTNRVEDETSCERRKEHARCKEVASHVIQRSQVGCTKNNNRCGKKMMMNKEEGGEGEEEEKEKEEEERKRRNWHSRSNNNK